MICGYTFHQILANRIREGIADKARLLPELQMHEYIIWNKYEDILSPSYHKVSDCSGRVSDVEAKEPGIPLIKVSILIAHSRQILEFASATFFISNRLAYFKLLE